MVKQKQLDYLNEWKKRNPEKVRSYQKTSKLRNRDKLLKGTKEWRLKNKEHVKEYCRQYRLKNRDKINKANREYRLRNPEKTKRLRKKYRDKAIKKPEVIFQRYVANAKTRNLSFEITFEEFKKFVMNNCHYCGELPNPLNGIDRKNNEQGYIKTNCLPCCKHCNRIKGVASYDDFLSCCHKVSIFKKLKYKK